MSPLERHGLRMLLAPVEPVKPQTNARCYYVYVVYASQGGDLCAVEIGPLAAAAAEHILGQHACTWVEDRKGYGGWSQRATKSGAVGAYMIQRKRHDEKWSGDTHLAAKSRVVRFPSQDRDASESLKEAA